MGAHPTLESRHTSRLAHPRTNTSSSSSLNRKTSSIESEVSPSSDSAPSLNGADIVLPFLAGEHRSRRNSRSKIRAHLFGTGEDTTSEDTTEEDGEGRKGILDAARGVRDRLSKTSASVSRRASLRLSFGQLTTSQSRLSLVRETAIQLDDTDYVVDQIKEKAFYDRLAAYNHISSPVDEDLHVDAIISPIRRRSLFTPGIATRDSSDILQRPPPPQHTQTGNDADYYFNPKHSSTSPLSNLAALDPRQSNEPPVPRVSTPSDLTYSHLAGLRPGTLRITNGTRTDSPAPRALSPSSLAQQPGLETKSQDDYYTASEGRHSDDEDTKPSYGQRNDVADTVIIGNLGGTSDRKFWRTSQEILSDHRSIQRHGSPLRYEHSRQGSSSEEEQLDSSGTPRKLRSLSLPPKAPYPGNFVPLVAQDYIAELAESPFGPSSSVFDPTFTSNEINDELCSDEDPNQLQSPTRGRWSSSTADIGNRSSDNGFEGAINRLENVLSRLDQISVPQTKRNRNSIPRKPVGTYAMNEASAKPECQALDSAYPKADSGYCSSTSSKSNKRKSLPAHKDFVPLRPAMKSIRSTSRTRPVPETLPPFAESLTRSKTDLDHLASNTMPPPAVVGAASVDPTNPSSEVVISHTLTNVSKTENTKKQRKLFKARPKSLPPPADRIAIHKSQEISQTQIPPVPAEIAAKHAQRLQDFPLLEHTFPSSQHTDARENMSPPSIVLASIRFPSPTKNRENSRSPANSREREFHSTSETQSGRQQSPRRGRRSRSASRDERRLSQQRMIEQCDVATTIADFGEITASLGSSPYDIAKSRLSADCSAIDSVKVGTSRRRDLRPTRARVGMGEKEAAEFARLRSQQRSRSMCGESSFHDHGKTRTAIAKPAISILDVFSATPLSAQSKRNSFNDRFNDRGGIPGKLPKPKSMCTDVPPMPALPSLEQVQHKEATLLRRQKSLTSPEKKIPHGAPTTNPAPLRAEAFAANPAGSADPPAGWENEHEAWFQRRKSAQEALDAQIKFRISRNDTPPPPQRLPPPLPPSLPPQPIAPLSSIPLQSALAPRSQSSNALPNPVPQPASRSLHTSLTPPHRGPGSVGGPAASWRHSGVPTGHGTYLSGRFDGGFGFGYEPGVGIGGSAGTRSGGTGASRKSVGVSRGFGVDLSDVPIFVAERG